MAFTKGPLFGNNICLYYVCSACHLHFDLTLFYAHIFEYSITLF